MISSHIYKNKLIFMNVQNYELCYFIANFWGI